MALPTIPRPKPARLSRIERHPHFPFGTADLFYRPLKEDGSALPQERALRVVLSADDCRQLARHFEVLAAEIEGLGAQTH